MSIALLGLARLLCAQASPGSNEPAAPPAPVSPPGPSATPETTPAPAAPPAAPAGNEGSNPQVPPPPPATPPAPPPVPNPAGTGEKTLAVIQVNRYTELKGTIEDEDDMLIVLRDQRGELHSLTKTRVLKIVRLVKPQPGQSGAVVLRDGHRHSGTVLEDSLDRVVLEVQGIRATYPREVVDYVVLDPTFQERYTAMKQGLESYSPQRHFELCRWLFSQRRYDLAEQELLELVRNSDMPEAHDLLKLTRAQLALETAAARPPLNGQRPGVPDAPGSPGSGDEPKRNPVQEPEAGERNSGPVIPADTLPKELISEDDVNLMRVYEIDFSDPPKVAVDADTIRTLIESYASNSLIPAEQEQRNAMFRADPLQLVRLMFELRARELYGRVKVISEPASLNLFRRRVHNTWLINNCATSACHGGVNAGHLFLHRRNHNDDRVCYTNLLILERLKVNDQWPLINYEQPRMSLIIQYGLPVSEARLRHPEVKGWEPVFKSSNRRMLDGTLRWIDSMMQPRPDYPIQYEPPILHKDPDQPEKPPDPDRPPR